MGDKKINIKISVEAEEAAKSLSLFAMKAEGEFAKLQQVVRITCNQIKLEAEATAKQVAISFKRMTDMAGKDIKSMFKDWHDNAKDAFLKNLEYNQNYRNALTKAIHQEQDEKQRALDAELAAAQAACDKEQAMKRAQADAAIKHFYREAKEKEATQAGAIKDTVLSALPSSLTSILAAGTIVAGCFVAIGIAAYAAFTIANQIIDTTISLVWSLTKTLASTLYDVVVGAFNSVINVISFMASTAEAAFSSIISAASNMAQRVWGIISNLSDQVSSAMDRMFKTSKTAGALGSTIEGFKKLQYAAQKAGVDVHTVDAAMSMLDRSMGRAMSGKKGDASIANWFKDAKLPIEEMTRMSADKSLTALAVSIDSMNTAAAKAGALHELGFSKGAAQIGRILAFFHEINKQAKDGNREFELLYNVHTIGYAKIQLATEATLKMKLVWQSFIDNIAVKVSGYIVNICDLLVDLGFNAENMGNIVDEAWDKIITGAAASAAFIKIAYDDLPGTMKLVWANIVDDAKYYFFRIKLAALDLSSAILQYFNGIGPTISQLIGDWTGQLDQMINGFVHSFTGFMKNVASIKLSWGESALDIASGRKITAYQAGLGMLADKLESMYQKSPSIQDIIFGKNGTIDGMGKGIDSTIDGAIKDIEKMRSKLYDNFTGTPKELREDNKNFKSNFDKKLKEYKEYIIKFGDITKEAKAREKEIIDALFNQGKGDEPHEAHTRKKELGFAQRLDSVSQIWGLQQSKQQIMEVDGPSMKKAARHLEVIEKLTARPHVARAG